MRGRRPISPGSTGQHKVRTCVRGDARYGHRRLTAGLPALGGFASARAWWRGRQGQRAQVIRRPFGMGSFAAFRVFPSVISSNPFCRHSAQARAGLVMLQKLQIQRRPLLR